MATTRDWGFYGRETELTQLSSILDRKRWFFAKVTGRRRIGKTSLIQRALSTRQDRAAFYVQIPDSGPAGVLSAVIDAMETFQVDVERFPRPRTLSELASFVARLVTAGYVVALDEFQYFVRDRLSDFTSFLQTEVDTLIHSRLGPDLCTVGCSFWVPSMQRWRSCSKIGMRRYSIVRPTS
jgi:uncharacterized protein